VKKTISLFSDKKGKEKITILTCYDYSTARYLSESNIDSILVGDTLGMVFQGQNSTLPVTIEDIVYHMKTVRRGAPDTFLIGDMPFLSYHISTEEAIRNAGKLMQEGSANAVKLEGGEEVLDKIKGIIAAKIPVMGHLGLTPQSVNVFGGFKVQGKDYETAERILKDALLIEKAGVFSIVLECVPEKLAKLISEKLKIPTIGIGSGRFTDGQVLVINDALGITKDFNSKFVKVFADVGNEIKKGIDGYIDDVAGGKYPEEKHGFKIDDIVIEKLKKEF
jgi:3-methyl-2-oxobutanoate hydroxymethyltransferase